MRRFFIFLCSLALQIPAPARSDEPVRPVGDSKRTDLAAATVPHRGEVRQLVSSVRAAADEVRDYTGTLVKQERFGDKLTERVTMQVKWARPYRIYFRNVVEPQQGREILFVQGENGGEIIAHRGKFPDVTVNLDPRGDTAMGENHHGIDKASLIDLVLMLEANVVQASERQEGEVTLNQETLWGRPCMRLEISKLGGGFFHTVRRGETLWDIARSTDRDMYRILHANASHSWKEPDDPREGDQVFVPRYYGSRLVVWIDQDLRLPIKALVYDDAGRLYESYEHRDLRVNVGLTRHDFDAKNPSYNF